MNYQEAISYLEGLKIFGIRLGLTRIERLLELLGRPQDRYRTVHVTGTNGKGSVSAMVEGAQRHPHGLLQLAAPRLVHGAHPR